MENIQETQTDQLDQVDQVDTNELKLPEMDENLARLMREIEDKTKKSCLLFCEKTDKGDDNPIATKIGGTDFYFPSNKKWPINEETNRMLTPVIQINFEEYKGYFSSVSKGLLQIFMDFDQENDDFIIKKNSNNVDIRFIADPNKAKARTITPDEENISIVGPYNFNKKDFLSLPSAHSRHDLPEEHLFNKWSWNKIVNKETSERMWSIYNYTEGLYIEDEFITRIGGYAPWITKDQSKVCPVCNSRMEFIAAIGTDDTNFKFDGDGYMMIFICNSSKKCPGPSDPSIIIQTY